MKEKSPPVTLFYSSLLAKFPRVWLSARGERYRLADLVNTRVESTSTDIPWAAGHRGQLFARPTCSGTGAGGSVSCRTAAICSKRHVDHKGRGDASADGRVAVENRCRRSVKVAEKITVVKDAVVQRTGKTRCGSSPCWRNRRQSVCVQNESHDCKAVSLVGI